MTDSGQHDWHSLDQRQVLELLDADSRYQRPMVPLFSSQSTMPIALLMFAQVVFLLLRKWISGHSAQLSRPTTANHLWNQVIDATHCGHNRLGGRTAASAEDQSVSRCFAGPMYFGARH